MELKSVKQYVELDKAKREEYIRDKLGYKKVDELVAVYTHGQELEKSSRGAYFFTELINKHTEEKFPSGEEVLSGLSVSGGKRPVEILSMVDYEKYSFRENSQYLIEFTLSDAKDYFQNGRLLNQSSFLQRVIPEDFTILLSEIKYELENIGYYYSDATLRRVLLSLTTGEVTLLAGPSGTGKTSLVSSLAKVLGAECEIISVQPNWQDKQDLLGFYNPMRREYFATSFVDTLIEASKKENRDKLYFICLDEINLAKVEYYFAELLSSLELEEPQIRLYSDSEYKKNKKRAQIIEKAKNESVGSLEDYDLRQQVENNNRYKSQLRIPDNVRIFGTMNMDGLIEPLSSKVIDRSIIIPLESEAETVYQEKRATDYIPFNLKASDFKMPKPIKGDQNFLDDFNHKLSTILKHLKLPYHYRFKKQVEDYFIAGSSHGVTEDELLDDIILTKVLPRIHRSDASIFEIDWDQDEYKALKYSQKKFNQMKDNIDKTSMFSYWVN